VFRADAAFAKPEVYEALEERGVKYAIRIAANDSLERDIAELLTRPVGRPGKSRRSGTTVSSPGRRGGSASDVQYSAVSVEILFLQRLDRLSSGENDQFNFAMLSIAFQLVCHR
jgi:hypothetical protein